MSFVSFESGVNAKEYRDIMGIERDIYAPPYKFLDEGVRGKWSYDDEDYVLFIEKINDRVVAYALLDVEGPFVYLDDVAVSPAHRSKGLAKEVVRRVIEWAKVDKRRVFLKVAMDNERALNLYASTGFVMTDDETQRPNMPLYPGHVFMHFDP